MKLKSGVKTYIGVSLAVIVLALLYFTFFMPFWNFMVKAELGDVEYVDVDPIDSITIDKKSYKPNGNNSNTNPNNGMTYLPKVEEGSLNVLILGADDAAGLVDTIIIANINGKSKEVTFISIPRDAYVPYDTNILDRISSAGLDTTKGIYKINAAPYIGEHVINYQGGKFENKGISFLCDIIELMVGYKIDEYIHINFEGFIELINIFKGVYVTSDEPIYNNKGELIVPEGRSFMDGKKALFFVRARYRYDEHGNQLPSPGDNYRKAHQLSMIQEVASQLVTARNIGRANDILTSLKKNVHHSLNMDKLNEYTPIALDFAKGLYTMESVLIKGKSINPLGDNAAYVDILH